MQQSRTVATTQGSSATLTLFTLLLLVDSLHFIFARAFAPYFDPAVSSMYVMVIALLEVGLFTILRGRFDFGILRKHLWFFIAIGTLVGASTILSYGSVEFIDPGAASMLAKMSTLFSLGFGLFWLHERLSFIQIGGAILCFAGVLIITFTPGDFLRLGALMVIASTLLYALHTAIVKRHGNDIDFLNFFFMRVFFTALFLVLYVFTRASFTVPTLNMWWLLLAAATVDVVISRTLYYIALRRLTMSMHAIILTLSPVATVLWSIAIFNSVPGAQEMIGGFAVLAGVAIATLPFGRTTQ